MFFSLLQAGECNFLSSYSRNLGPVDLPIPVHLSVCCRSGNCSVERIPLTSPDSELVEASHVRLKHAKELLDVDPTQFMYSGEVSRLQTISSSCWGSWYSTNSKGDAEKSE